MAKKKPIVQEPENYFIYLKNPLEYRRQLLESSKKSIHALKNYQKILLIRQKKIEESHKLKILLKELMYLSRKFNEKLPKYELTELPVKVEKSVSAPIHPAHPSHVKPAHAPQREKTELERLEESLASIEKKLKALQ